MDILTFIANVIGSLAWPITMLTAVILLRKPIGKLLPLLRRAKYKDLDLEFGQKLEELEQKANRASLPKSIEPPVWAGENPDDWTFGDYIERLAPISPRVAISEAWRHVELALKEAAKKLGIAESRDTLQVAKAMQESGMLSRDAVSLLADLRGLRNRAVHAKEFDLDPDQAMEFARLAERLLASIQVSGIESK